MILPRALFLLFLAFLATIITLLVRRSGPASGNHRSLRARFRQSFLNVVPQPARRIATVLFFIALFVGTVFGFVGGHSQMMSDHAHGHFPAYGPYLPELISLVCLIPAAFIGSLFALWVLGLGFVWADARRRNMPHIPWTLVAAIVPNLLGFLLYFVLRKPIASPCPQCGQPIAVDQRFCPTCGAQAFVPPAATPPPQPV